MSDIWGPPIATDVVEDTMAALRTTHAYINQLVTMRDVPGDGAQELVLSWQDDPDAPQACKSEIFSISKYDSSNQLAERQFVFYDSHFIGPHPQPTFLSSRHFMYEALTFPLLNFHAENNYHSLPEPDDITLHQYVRARVFMPDDIMACPMASEDLPTPPRHMTYANTNNNRIPCIADCIPCLGCFSSTFSMATAERRRSAWRG